MYKRFTDTQKWCSDCAQWLAHDQFHKSSLSVSGLATYCKKHVQDRNRVKHGHHYRAHKAAVLAKNTDWRRRNVGRYKSRPSARSEYRRAYKRMHLYGLSSDAYQEKWDKQRGLCAVARCGRPIRDIDHNHTTGETRDLLCNQCNSALGLFRDSPSLLRSAATYLESHGVR